MNKLEKDIEVSCCKWASKNGWLTYKFQSANNRGVPDRLFIRNGITVYVEFKRPTTAPTRLQEAVHAQIRAHGAKVHVISDFDHFCEVMQ